LELCGRIPYQNKIRVFSYYARIGEERRQGVGLKVISLYRIIDSESSFATR
jgi:hypothetical protein